jgi:hypothetical protein
VDKNMLRPAEDHKGVKHIRATFFPFLLKEEIKSMMFLVFVHFSVIFLKPGGSAMDPDESVLNIRV